MKIVDDEPSIKTGAASKEYRDNWDRVFGEKTCAEAVDVLAGCGVCGELESCVCDDHDPACARLCTEGAYCDCDAAVKR